MNNFLSRKDVDDLPALIGQALDFKKSPLSHEQLGRGKTLGLIFMNPSLRTRLSTQRAAFNLGMNVIVVNLNQDSWQLEFEDGTTMNGSSAEHIKDAGGVLSQYCDILGIRTFANLQDRERDYEEYVLSKFAQHISVPVISLESATLHPLQSLADLVTLSEYQTSPKPKIVLSWAPHPKALPQAVANSFLEWTSSIECNLVVTHPPGYELADKFTANATVTNNQHEALAEADFVYVKNWSSYQQYGKVLRGFDDWTLNQQKMDLTKNGHFMHCLPLRRNVVATDEVVDQSLVIPQAQNRLYAAQAVLHSLLSS